MSRSKKKTRISGITTAKSEKKDKREANRKFRRRTREAVNHGSELLPQLRETSNVWSFGKDGKRFYKDMSEREMRK